MNDFKSDVEIRWSDLDPNFHLRHSAYYDFGAFARIDFFTRHGLTFDVMLQHNIGPILFREECVFKREINFNDKVEVDLQLIKSIKDGSRWTMVHNIWKNDDILSAIITIDAAWIDIAKRKLCTPPDVVMNAFKIAPKAEDFEWSV